MKIINFETSYFKAKLLAYEDMNTMAGPEVLLANPDRFGMDDINKRFDSTSFYNVGSRRGSFDSGLETDLDDYKTTPKEQLLNMIKLYNYLHNQGNSGRNI